jgi:hypothetical protein
MTPADCITDEGDALRIRRHPALSDAQWAEIGAALSALLVGVRR